MFLADGKMYSTGVLRMYKDGIHHARSVPKVVVGKAIQEALFTHISANIGTIHECNCAISDSGTFYSWGNNAGGQQGNMVLPVPADGASTGHDTEEDRLAPESEQQQDASEDDNSSESEEEPSESQESDEDQQPDDDQQSDDDQQPDDDGTRQYDGAILWLPDPHEGEIFSCDPVCRGREHFGGETPATAVCSDTAYFVLTDEGNVWCVGIDARIKDLLMPGQPSHIFAKIPSELFGTSAVASIAIGSTHMLAVCTAGFVWAWGSNSFCALGVEDDTEYHEHPRMVHCIQWDETRFSAVSAGSHASLALDTDGTLWEWGLMHALTRVHSRTGRMLTSMHVEPSQVLSLDANFTSPIVAIRSGSSFTLALDDAGRVWSFGMGECGELGLGRQTVSHTPIQIVGFANQHPITSISSGDSNCGAISSQGDVYIWGNNFYSDTRGRRNTDLGPGQRRRNPEIISTPMLVMVFHKHSQNVCTAFLMSLHRRLGASSQAGSQLKPELVDMILQPTHQGVSAYDRSRALE